MLNITSLLHPAMIAKIRLGLKLAALNKGHEMGGHANRVYIANRKGHNIMRIDWHGRKSTKGPFIAYGGADWGRTDITDIVKEALRRANVKPNPTLPQDGYKVTHNKLYKGVLSIALAFACMLGNPSELAQWMPNPQAMEQACNASPEMLICQMEKH